MIRKLQQSDTARVMDIWLHGNEDAHPFIPKEYWRSNFDDVQEQILQAEVFVYEDDGEILGFLGLVDGYIAGIFVDGRYRSHGVGKQLLEYAKQRYDTLSLGVYQKNGRAAAFYTREGFSVQSERIDENTGETEYTMVWNAGQETLKTMEQQPDHKPIWKRLYEAARNVQNPRQISDSIEAGQVAAALLTKDGSIYTGICIDTACSLGMCAERNAIAHMLTCGESEITKLAVIGSDGAMVLPCGACCELMMQLGPWAGEIEILTDQQKAETRKLKEIFPNWWGKNKGGEES